MKNYFEVYFSTGFYKTPHSLKGPYVYSDYWVQGQIYYNFIEYIKAVITYKEKSLDKL